MDKHPIIAKGEIYSEPITKKISGGPKSMPRTYDEAKIRMIEDLEQLTREIESSNEIFLEERVVCIRLEPSFEAKSYVPNGIISVMNVDGDSKIVGGRRYIIEENGQKKNAKLYFVKTSDKGIRQLRNTLENGTRDNVDIWKKQIQSINVIDLLKPEEKIMGFEEEWAEGTVEFVLHPIPSSTQDEVEQFFSYSGIDIRNARTKTYDDGITFISASCSLKNLERIKVFNPLRAAHPLGKVSISEIRGVTGSSCPTVYPFTKQPEVHVGVFDGGVEASHPLLDGYVTDITCTKEKAIEYYVSHGTGVCSALLYGNLAGKTGHDVLETPCVSIDCYRVLPLHNKADIDLYEVIDQIEAIVPGSDTKLYNLSLGPRGAIIDDSISRFTYALDKLSYEVPQDDINPLFVVATGNDGELPAPLNRIQSPSDIVNGIGVGAYTYDYDGNRVPASYSCSGPGREGAKTKPDLLEFGGSIDRPFIIPNIDKTSLSATAGTSFAAPVITGKIGKLMAMSDSIVPHMGRVLLLHNAVLDKSFTKDNQGFGFCPDDISDLLECYDNRVSIIYSGTIIPSQTLKLPIFAPGINEVHGNVSISWTVATVVAPYANDPDAYTNNCLEDVFTPHSMVYSFSKTGKGSKKLNLLNPNDIRKVRQLIDSGYRQSSVPVSHPAKKLWNEEDLRAGDLKWDTIIHKEIRMRGSSLFDPSLTLHAIGRNGFEKDEIRYYVVVTIDAQNYSGKLYDSILQTYQNLAPIEIRNVNRLMV